MKTSPNITLVNLVLLNYVLVCLNGTVLTQYFELPSILLTIVFFFLLALIYRIYSYILFIAVSFSFLSVFFAYLEHHTLAGEAIYQTWMMHLLTINLYYLVLIPCLFLTYTLNFYLLAEEISGMGNGKIARYSVPVLVKRELILHRYRQLLFSFESKGHDTQSAWGRLRNMHLWMVPLIITTLIEGVESYEYNKMLGTDISKYVPVKRIYYISVRQKISFFLLTLSLLSLMIYYYV